MQTIEYKDCTDSMLSHETVLKNGYGAFSRPFELRHVSEGYEIAGSAMRHVNECWRVVSYDRDGTRRSKAFKTEAEATADFDCWTEAITELK